MSRLVRWGPVFAAAFAAVGLRAELLVLYPGSPGAGAVGRFDAASGIVLPAFGHENEGMFALCVAGNGDVFASADILGAGLIYRFDRNGKYRGKIADIRGADFHALAIGSQGEVFAVAYVTDPAEPTRQHAEIIRFPGGGAPAEIFVAEGAAGMTAPQALVFGPDKNLYVADARAGVLRFDGATGAPVDVFVPVANDGLRDAAALAFDPAGRLYVASAGASAVFRFDGSTGQLIDTFVAPQDGGLRAPRGIAFGPDGNLYVSSQGFDHVLRFDGRTGMFLGGIVGNREFRSPSALAFEPTVNTAAAGRSDG